MNVDELRSVFAAHWEKREEGTERTEGTGSDEIVPPWQEQEQHLQRLIRPVKVSAAVGNPIDRSVISYPLYNSFNYSIFLPKDHAPIRLSLGITSPNSGEGKTTTVCNLATALSMGSGRKTVVVDVNLARPRIHEIFGTPRGPGLAEALNGQDICVAPTQVRNLFVMTIGHTNELPPHRLSEFRDILSSLLNEFEFVLVDLPSAGTRTFPTLIANQLNGLLVVVRPKATKRKDVGKVFRRVREEKIIGFIMNGVNERDF